MDTRDRKDGHMELLPTRPVTIGRAADAQWWFPSLRTIADGSLLLYVQNGHDLAFSPVIRTRSSDRGRTWHRMRDLVPRCTWCHSFADGELVEFDFHPIADPRRETDFEGLAAWSRPHELDDVPVPGRARFRNTSISRIPAPEWINGNPTMPWWPLWQDLCGFEPNQFDKVFLGGPMLTDGVELPDGRLLALGYGRYGDSTPPRYATFAYESGDRGRTWDEVGIVTDLADGSAETNEAAVVRLSDGRLYAVLRTLGPFVHSASSDEGRTWSKPTPLTFADEPDHAPGHAWPCMITLHDGSLVLAYGRPGKHVVIDPSGTGTQWQARLNLHEWELDTQAAMGVPDELQLHGVVGHYPDGELDRYHDSSDYLAVVEPEPGVLLVIYDVHGYIGHWNAEQVDSALRMVQVSVCGKMDGKSPPPL